MAAFLAVILAFPSVIYTVLLGVVLVYWLFVFIGALHINALGEGMGDGALEGHADGAIDGHLDGALEGSGHADGALEGHADGAADGHDVDVDVDGPPGGL